MDRLRVPPIDFYQLRVSYDTLTVDDDPHTAERLRGADILQEADEVLVHEQDLTGAETAIYAALREEGQQPVTFRQWLCQISREGFQKPSVPELQRYEPELRDIFRRITVVQPDGLTLPDPRYDHPEIRSRIRRAFLPRRDFETRQETVHTHASLLQVERLTSPLLVTDDTPYYPPQDTVRDIVAWDNRPAQQPLTPEAQAAIALLRAQGITVPDVTDPHPERAHTYHYLPYRFDSGLEREYFARALRLIGDRRLELYFNGDDTLTDFKIDCYRQQGRGWVYIGRYVPDFLLLDRRADGSIHHVAIIETKGEGFAAKFADRRRFMDGEFIRRNNDRFGYRRFCFVYLEDTETPEAFLQRTLRVINEFFNESQE